MKAVVTIFILLLCHFGGRSQVVDSIVGLKRSMVQQLLRPYRILSYQRDLVVYHFDKGVTQTVLFKDDTCSGFYWNAEPDREKLLLQRMEQAGYTHVDESVLTRTNIVINRSVAANGSTFFNATVTPVPNRPKNGSDRSGRMTKGPIVLPLPRMQQEVLSEKADTVPKVKDPQRNWVGGNDTEVRLLGW